MQPAEPLDERKSPPFEPEERNGNIYARRLSTTVDAREGSVQRRIGQPPIFFGQSTRLGLEVEADFSRDCQGVALSTAMRTPVVRHLVRLSGRIVLRGQADEAVGVFV